MPLRDQDTTIGIIGALGSMGSFIAKRAQESGYQVLKADKGEGDLIHMAGSSHILILAVPFPSLEEVISSIASHLSPHILLMDITSVKVRPLEIMLGHTTCPVVGAHPLFGPEAFGKSGLRVVLCPGRGEDSLNRAKTFWKNIGLEVFCCSASEHDEIMALVQGLFHGITYSMAMCLKDSAAAKSETIKQISTFNFESMLQRIDMFLSQPQLLYETIFFENPFVIGAINQFLKKMEKLKDMILSKNYDLFHDSLYILKGVSDEKDMG